MLVRFPHEEQGKLRKPWHGPYRVVSRDDPDVTVVKMYFPQEPAIQTLRPELSSGISTWILMVWSQATLPRSWVEDLLERCVPPEPEAEQYGTARTGVE